MKEKIVVINILFFVVVGICFAASYNLITSGGQQPMTKTDERGAVDVETGLLYLKNRIENPPDEHADHVMFYGISNEPYFRDGFFGHHEIIVEDTDGELTLDPVANDGEGKMLCVKIGGTIGTCTTRPISPEVTCECE